MMVVTTIIFNHDSAREGGHLQLLRFVGGFCLFLVDLGGTYKLLYFFLLQSLKCTGLRFLFPWQKLIAVELLQFFKSIWRGYEDNFLYSAILFVIKLTFLMARRMLHYWLYPNDLRKIGSTKTMKNDQYSYMSILEGGKILLLRKSSNCLNFQDF